MSPLPLYSEPVEGAPLEVLSSGFLSAGGSLELRELQSDGTYATISFMNDVTSGLKLKTSLLGLDTLAFSVPHDRFSPSSSKLLTQIESQWTTSGRNPYAKARAVRDRFYIAYVTADRERVFRIHQLDYDDFENLSGEAHDAAVVLSDYMTHYVAGKDHFAGLVASEVADHILGGRHSLKIPNRRFVRDRGVKMTLATDIPTQIPVSVQTSPIPGVNYIRAPPIIFSTPSVPLPFVLEMPSIVPLEAGLFSGIPSDTPPPDGNLKTPSVIGGISCITFQDLISTPAHFTKVVAQGTLSGSFNFTDFSIIREPTTAFYAARVIFGLIQAPLDGLYSFRLNTSGNHRVYFQNKLVSDKVTTPSGVGRDIAAGEESLWSSNLRQKRWYPFVIHQIEKPTSSFAKLQWKLPGLAESIIPSNYLSPNLHGGYSIVRFTDNLDIVRFMLCYKRWDGKGLVLGYPLPASIFNPVTPSGSHWPAAVQAGTLVEEVSFPAVHPNCAVLNWGSGWTRRPGPIDDVYNIPARAASMQHRSLGY